MAKYTNVVILDGFKEATLAGASKYVDYIKDEDDFPVQVEIPDQRSYIMAIRKSLQLSKMGIFNIILKKT